MLKYFQTHQIQKDKSLRRHAKHHFDADQLRSEYGKSLQKATMPSLVMTIHGEKISTCYAVRHESDNIALFG